MFFPQEEPWFHQQVPQKMGKLLNQNIDERFYKFSVKYSENGNINKNNTTGWVKFNKFKKMFLAEMKYLLYKYLGIREHIKSKQYWYLTNLSNIKLNKNSNVHISKRNLLPTAEMKTQL